VHGAARGERLDEPELAPPLVRADVLSELADVVRALKEESAEQVDERREDRGDERSGQSFRWVTLVDARCSRRFERPISC